MYCFPQWLCPDDMGFRADEGTMWNINRLERIKIHFLILFGSSWSGKILQEKYAEKSLRNRKVEGRNIGSSTGK